MRAYRCDQLGDAELLRLLPKLVAEGRENTAKTIAVIAEVDRRRLYAPAGYESMRAYCLVELRLSEDAALKRIQVARASHEHPVLLEMLADGRLHLTGARLVAPHLTAENEKELLESAICKTKLEIEGLIAERFTEPDLLTVTCGDQHAPGHVEAQSANVSFEHAEGKVLRPEHAPGHVASAKTMNLAPPRTPFFLLPATPARIRRAKELLGHEFSSGDDALVVDRAMKELVERAEKRILRVARSLKTREASPSKNPRHIPKRVKSTVWERDGGQCTFVGNTGHRCGTNSYLQFDHIEPVARGGTSTVENLRLRCRAHNQLEAERALGTGFMDRKRKEARRQSEERARTQQETQDILNGLRACGVRRPRRRPAGCGLHARAR